MPLRPSCGLEQVGASLLTCFALEVCARSLHPTLARGSSAARASSCSASGARSLPARPAPVLSPRAPARASTVAAARPSVGRAARSAISRTSAMRDGARWRAVGASGTLSAAGRFGVRVSASNWSDALTMPPFAHCSGCPMRGREGHAGAGRSKHAVASAPLGGSYAAIRRAARAIPPGRSRMSRRRRRERRSGQARAHRLAVPMSRRTGETGRSTAGRSAG